MGIQLQNRNITFSIYNTNPTNALQSVFHLRHFFNFHHAVKLSSNARILHTLSSEALGTILVPPLTYDGNSSANFATLSRLIQKLKPKFIFIGKTLLAAFWTKPLRGTGAKRLLALMGAKFLTMSTFLLCFPLKVV